MESILRSDRPAALRTPEIEEPLNRFFIHRLSSLSVPVFVRAGVSPNTVSVIGLALACTAAVAYYIDGSVTLALTGFALMIGWHVMDGADGQLARTIGVVSDSGEIIDGVCDYLAYISVYVALALSQVPTMGWVAFAPFAVAGACHAAQASAYEYQRRAYDYWVHGKSWTRMASLANAGPDTKSAGILQSFSSGYDKLQGHVSATNNALEMRLMALSCAGDGLNEHAIAAYKEINIPAIKRWSVLSANYRTIAIFVAVLIGNPLYYCLYEIFALSGALALLASMQSRVNKKLLAKLNDLTSE